MQNASEVAIQCNPFYSFFLIFSLENLSPFKNVILTSEKIEHACEVIYKAGEPFHPAEIDVNDQLEFTIKKNEEAWLYSYFMCAQAIQEKPGGDSNRRHHNDRFWQNIYGFFPVSEIYKTKLNLSTSWDPETVQEKKIRFYRVNPVTCVLENPTLCTPDIMTYIREENL